MPSQRKLPAAGNDMEGMIRKVQVILVYNIGIEAVMKMMKMTIFLYLFIIMLLIYFLVISENFIFQLQLVSLCELNFLEIKFEFINLGHAH